MWSTTCRSGGFISNATTGVLDPAQHRPPSWRSPTRSRCKYFGVAATGTPGGAYNSLTAQQRQQVADAKAIRRAQIGVVFPTTSRRRLRRHTAGLGGQPELEDQRTVVDLRVLAARREGRHLAIRERHLEPGRAEKTEAYEIGLKTVLLERHAGVQHRGVLFGDRGLSAAVRIVDEYTTEPEHRRRRAAGRTPTPRHRQRAAA